MKILHIATTNFDVIKTFVKFVDCNFDINNHTFLIMSKSHKVPMELKRYSNVIILNPSNFVSLFKIIYKMYKFDKIILHSLNKTYFQLILLFAFTIHYKIFWIAWGADLYEWKSSKKNLKYIVRNKIFRQIRIRIKYFVGIFLPDIEFFKNEFKSDAKTFHASYVGSVQSEFYKKEMKQCSIEEKKQKNECINIQIGHSCTPILNHLEVLNELKKFRSENINIFIPLSYGDKKYGDMIENEAKKIYGDKVVCLRKIINKDLYYDFLATIDIAIFNTSRQIALGNITPMLYMEKKIFIPEESVMYKFYREQNIDICNYNDIKKFEFNEFIKPLITKGGRDYVINNELDLGKKIKMWKKVFDEPVK